MRRAVSGPALSHLGLRRVIFRYYFQLLLFSANSVAPPTSLILLVIRDCSRDRFSDIFGWYSAL